MHRFTDGRTEYDMMPRAALTACNCSTIGYKTDMLSHSNSTHHTRDELTYTIFHIPYTLHCQTRNYQSTWKL